MNMKSPRCRYSGEIPTTEPERLIPGLKRIVEKGQEIIDNEERNKINIPFFYSNGTVDFRPPYEGPFATGEIEVVSTGHITCANLNGFTELKEGDLEGNDSIKSVGLAFTPDSALGFRDVLSRGISRYNLLKERMKEIERRKEIDNLTRIIGTDPKRN